MVTQTRLNITLYVRCLPCFANFTPEVGNLEICQSYLLFEQPPGRDDVSAAAFLNTSLPLLSKCVAVLRQTTRVSSLHDLQNVFCICRIKIVGNNIMNTAKSAEKRQHVTLAHMEGIKADRAECGVGMWTNLIRKMVGNTVINFLVPQKAGNVFIF
jgi:hypothetical protein